MSSNVNKVEYGEMTLGNIHTLVDPPMLTSGVLFGAQDRRSSADVVYLSHIHDDRNYITKYRVDVNGTVKYVVIHDNVWLPGCSKDRDVWEKAKDFMRPMFPANDPHWTSILIQRYPSGDLMARYETRNIPVELSNAERRQDFQLLDVAQSITHVYRHHVWEFNRFDRDKKGHMRTKKIICKIARWPEDFDRLNAEQENYKRFEATAKPADCEGRRPIPYLLNQVLDHRGKPIGYLLSHVGDERPNMTNPDHRELCLEALRTLHQHGYLHGNVHPNNFRLNNAHNRACLIDLKEMREAASAEEYNLEVCAVANQVFSQYRPTTSGPSDWPRSLLYETEPPNPFEDWQDEAPTIVRAEYKPPIGRRRALAP